MNKVVFDLDGVLRDFWIYFNYYYGVPYPNKWDARYLNKSVFDWVKYDDYKSLIAAPITLYTPIVKKLFSKIEIWTCQPDKWRKNTIKWLNYHIKNYTLRYLTAEEKFEKLQKLPNYYLVEDYPLFPDYNRIILIDRPYNQNVKTPRRITNPDGFETIIKTLL